ncbi:MAG: formylglycine-generating enzyme family protein [Gemmataceae bacterium]|nr:formylglycine-generating enzyme family protein [Gemmataceae bacterium]
MSKQSKHETGVRAGHPPAAKKSHKSHSPAAAPMSRLRKILTLLGLLGFCAALAGVTYALWPTPKTGRAQLSLKPLPLNPDTPPGPAPEGMVWVRGGEFWMGGEVMQHNGIVAPDSLPAHKVYVDGFFMDKYEVTNEQWAVFAKETGYLTVAELKPDPKDFTKEQLDRMTPEHKKELFDHPVSLVFTPPREMIFHLELAHREHMWWSVVKQASWKQPEGPTSSIEGKGKHPVTHIAWVDAVEYCEWLSKKTGRTYRLPTEAEWEFAARGGLHQKDFPWGDDLTPDDKWMTNIWQGRFPNENSEADGFARAAPVGSFPPNDYGLYDMAGNVWEWCSDYYRKDYYKESPEKNPKGPTSSFDIHEPDVKEKRVQRGGSFLCSELYCIRFQVAARGKGEAKSGQNHIGFRTVCEAK